jgi:hypothetical protein
VDAAFEGKTAEKVDMSLLMGVKLARTLDARDKFSGDKIYEYFTDTVINRKESIGIASGEIAEDELSVRGVTLDAVNKALAHIHLSRSKEDQVLLLDLSKAVKGFSKQKLVCLPSDELKSMHEAYEKPRVLKDLGQMDGDNPMRCASLALNWAMRRIGNTGAVPSAEVLHKAMAEQEGISPAANNGIEARSLVSIATGSEIPVSFGEVMVGDARSDGVAVIYLPGGRYEHGADKIVEGHFVATAHSKDTQPRMTPYQQNAMREHVIAVCTNILDNVDQNGSLRADHDEILAFYKQEGQY